MIDSKVWESLNPKADVTRLYSQANNPGNLRELYSDAESMMSTPSGLDRTTQPTRILSESNINIFSGGVLNDFFMESSMWTYEPG